MGSPHGGAWSGTDGKAAPSPDLSQILDTHPGLKRHRTVVVELAYEEFCLRRNAGEALDPVEFSGRFRSFERSIDCYLAFHSFVDNDPELAALKQKVAWPEAGCQFLGFHLIRELGRGAAGRVFLASELALSERLVALKVTVEGCHEAKMLGRLQHSNIVPIHSFREEGDAGELTAFWMPYCGQATLAAVLDSLYAPRPAVQAGNARRPCRRCPTRPAPPGLGNPCRHRRRQRGRGNARFAPAAFAHADCLLCRRRDSPGRAARRGACPRSRPQHLPSRPETVEHSLRAEGRPLLLDFNLSVDRRSPIWRIGGTLPYMAPEELASLREGRACEKCFDARSDLFSLGVILYELLTGELPFGKIKYDCGPERIAQRLLKRQAKGPRPLRKGNRLVDRRLAGLIESCLAFDRERRPANAEALASALRKELALPGAPAAGRQRTADWRCRSSRPRCLRPSPWPLILRSARRTRSASTSRGLLIIGQARTSWRCSVLMPRLLPLRTGGTRSSPVPVPRSAAETSNWHLPITTPPTNWLPVRKSPRARDIA